MEGLFIIGAGLYIMEMRHIRRRKPRWFECCGRRFFLCFPVVTTTLHSFRKTTFPMIPGLFDLLLIDESGQIVPYYALAPLYRAGRAVFVGDGESD